MKTVFQTSIAGFNIKLEQMARNKFNVIYGEQAATKLTYAEAAKELGECVLHALTCEGKLD